MLQNLSEQVRECLRRAEECAQQAKHQCDPKLAGELKCRHFVPVWRRNPFCGDEFARAGRFSRLHQSREL